jgi:hypothetical protein
MLLCEAIEQVESGGNPQAIRFEPGLFEGSAHSWQFSKATVIGETNKCDGYSSFMLSCTSFGLYQLLGVNIYAMGFTGTIFDYVNDVNEQLDVATKFFKSLNLPLTFNQDLASISQTDLLLFARQWNGSGNPAAYARAIRYAANS